MRFTASLIGTVVVAVQVWENPLAVLEEFITAADDDGDDDEQEIPCFVRVNDNKITARLTQWAASFSPHIPRAGRIWHRFTQLLPRYPLLRRCADPGKCCLPTGRQYCPKSFDFVWVKGPLKLFIVNTSRAPRMCMKVLIQVLFVWALNLPTWIGLAHPTLRGLSSDWSFEVYPSVNGTSNLIFDSVANLLQQWGNTHYRNGHNVVPATIPVGTILYHGTHHKVIPTREWLAVDPEHAYPFCQDPRGEDGEGCFLLTVAVSRPLNLLYIDGSSAAKMYGAIDIQDLIAWGEVIDTMERIYDEWTRLELLCSWAMKFGLDGFLRMEMDFEVMLCDFSKGVEAVSFIELDYPNGSSTMRPSLTTLPSTIKFLSPAFRILEAGHWHNHFPGETRAKLDLSRLISLYDLNSFPSLVDQRLGKERWEYRARGISDKDRNTLIHNLETVALSRSSLSGIDWQSIYRVVIHRYADRLELLQYMLNHRPMNGTTLDTVHGYVGSMLATYIPRGVVPSRESSASLDWASPVFERCTTLHVEFIMKVEGLTSSEQLLLKALYDVLHEICRVTTGLWAEGLELKLEGEPFPIGTTLEKWRDSINELVRWLDWSVWVKCKPTCGYEEICYLPTWPFFNRNLSIPTPGIDESQAFFSPHYLNRQRTPQREDVPLSEWVNPQPRCMRRLAPFDTRIP